MVHWVIGETEARSGSEGAQGKGREGTRGWERPEASPHRHISGGKKPAHPKALALLLLPLGRIRKS